MFETIKFVRKGVEIISTPLRTKLGRTNQIKEKRKQNQFNESDWCNQNLVASSVPSSGGRALEDKRFKEEDVTLKFLFVTSIVFD